MDPQRASAPPPAPSPAPGTPAPQMGRFSLEKSQGLADSPITAAQRAYLAAQSSGQGDPFSAAKAAWLGAVKATSDRLSSGQSDQLQPGDRNLRLIAGHIQQQYRVKDPVVAYALAHETMAGLGAQQGQQQAQPGRPAPPAPGG